ncbi:hypothetical protein VE01_06130 [Pseudogymnoascus verrucosus]|uniref:Uncharacterized protein n=1 Tax=Pseudogymnoascus verrucosus TaxID=342668 RepID=A0A1B8GJ62_9PEZI|nr:uncharacterized protein VE01_06130 [Pseudogymnoascus verrucosus]OBT95859.1 hypothetical protein VE01_06130 [Pseudogymnoascus verrucosus]
MRRLLADNGWNRGGALDSTQARASDGKLWRNHPKKPPAATRVTRHIGSKQQCVHLIPPFGPKGTSPGVALAIFVFDTRCDRRTPADESQRFLAEASVVGIRP